MSEDVTQVENHTERLLGFNGTLSNGTKVFVELVPGVNRVPNDKFDAIKGGDYFKAHKEAKHVSKVKTPKKDKKKKEKKD